MKILEYKFRETSDVSDQSLTEIMNEMTAEGWRFESLHFAMRESSKRPSMAYLLFSKSVEES